MTDIMLRDLPKEELPRERFKKLGVERLTNEELITILIRSGYKNVSAKSLALQVLKEIGSLESLKDISFNSLLKIKGLGETKVITLLVGLELGKRVYIEEHNENVKLNNPDIIYSKFKELFLNEKQELFYVAYLDKRHKLISYEMLFKGTLDSSIVHPREIFKGAVKNSAASIIIMHNHPSNDVSPSNEDINFTNIIKKLSKMMGIGLDDHIIFGNNRKYSFYENGLI